MELDDPLRKRIEAVLSAYASPGCEDRAAAYADRITHLAKIAMCVKLELDPPQRPPCVIRPCVIRPCVILHWVHLRLIPRWRRLGRRCGQSAVVEVLQQDFRAILEV